MTEPGSDVIRVIDGTAIEKPLPLVRGEGTAYAVLWPGNGARYRTFNLIDLKKNDITRDLSHASECAYYVAAGGGVVRSLDDGETQELVEGSMIHIGTGDAYRLEAGPHGMRVIGGPVPVDPALYELAEDEVNG